MERERERERDNIVIYIRYWNFFCSSYEHQNKLPTPALMHALVFQETEKQILIKMLLSFVIFLGIYYFPDISKFAIQLFRF